MPTVHKHRTNETKHTVLFSRTELEHILREHAARCAGLNPEASVTYEVKIEDNMEGSPQYKSGYKAQVSVTVKHEEEQG